MVESNIRRGIVYISACVCVFEFFNTELSVRQCYQMDNETMYCNGHVAPSIENIT